MQEDKTGQFLSERRKVFLTMYGKGHSESSELLHKIISVCQCIENELSNVGYIVIFIRSRRER